MNDAPFRRLHEAGEAAKQALKEFEAIDFDVPDFDACVQRAPSERYPDVDSREMLAELHLELKAGSSFASDEFSAAAVEFMRACRRENPKATAKEIYQAIIDLGRERS